MAAFDDRYSDPEYSLSRVVFYPDRIYHAAALAASPRSARYRYNVQHVRSKLAVVALMGDVYLDGRLLCPFMRLEYQPGRLVEAAGERHRILGERVEAWLRLEGDGSAPSAEAHVTLHLQPERHGYYVEVWGTLEPPATSCHDFGVLDLMGWQRPITRIPALDAAWLAGRPPQRIEIAFAEHDRASPAGSPIADIVWDNNFLASHQERRSTQPSAPENTLADRNYLLDFQRGWCFDAGEVPAVQYRNPLMDPDNPDRSDTNVIEMRWLLQRTLGGSVVFFHRVTVPPGATEGTHQHVGSEEVYYVVEGTGTAYLGEHDDPALTTVPTVTRHVYGIGPRSCKAIPVRPGTVIFTKSGGMHGIRNDGTQPLTFVAFLYHTQ